MAYPEMPRMPLPRIDLSSPQEARHSIAVVMSHLDALDLFLENICRGHWQWGNNWQGTTWSDGQGASSGSYYYEGPPGQWHAQSGPPGNWQTETQSGEPWNPAYAAEGGTTWGDAEAAPETDGNHPAMALLERLQTDPNLQREDSPPLPDVHQVLQSLSGGTGGGGSVGVAVNESTESPQGSLYSWYRGEGERPSSGTAETSAEGAKSGSDASRDGETGETADGGFTPSSNNEGERSASSSGPRNEDTEGQPLEFAASHDAAGADENPDANPSSANPDASASDGDPDARRRGWRIGRSDRPTPLDGTSAAPLPAERSSAELGAAGSEPPGGEEDNRPLGPLPPGLAGYRLKRAPWKSPPTPIPPAELEETVVAKPIPIQKMPARRRIAPEEAAVPAQPKAKPPPYGMAATAPPRKMPPVAKAAAAAAASTASTAPPAPMRNPTTTAVPPQPQPKSSSYKAPPGPLVYKQPPAAAAAAGMPSPSALAKGVRGVKAPPGPRPNGEGSALSSTSTLPMPSPPGAGSHAEATPAGREGREGRDGDEARTKSRAEAKEMFQKKSGPVPPAPKALNPADGEIEVVDV